jgi:hypothetical protein
VTYGDLDIADGGAASAVFYGIVANSSLSPEDRDTLRESLLKYCARDTLALAQIHQWLIRKSYRTFMDDTVLYMMRFEP